MRIHAVKSQTKTDREYNTSQNIAQRVEAPAAVRLQIFSARDFAVTAIHDAVNLEKRSAANEPQIITAPQRNETRDGKRKDRPCPRVWRDRRFQKTTADRSGNRAIKKSGNESILWFAGVAEKPAFAPRNLAGFGDVTPSGDSSGFARIATNLRKNVSKFLPKFYCIDNQRLELKDWREGNEVGQRSSLDEEPGAENARQASTARPISFRSKI